MSLALRQVKVYFRLTLIILVAVAVIMVLWKNRRNEVGIWFFWLVEKEVNVVWLMLCTAVGTLIAYWMLHMVWALWREMKKAALDSALTDRQQQQERRDQELQEREKRIDAKLKDAISEE